MPPRVVGAGRSSACLAVRAAQCFALVSILSRDFYGSSYLTKSKTHALSKEEYELIIAQPCHYCGKLTVPDHHYNGLDRLDSSVRVYTPESCVAACGTCNTMKWRRSPAAFIQHCAAVATFQAVPTGTPKAATRPTVRTSSLYGVCTAGNESSAAQAVK